MNTCLQCGKKIDDRHKFCSSSCAAKYNNKRRTRKPWTEEQRRAIRKKKESYIKNCGCKYCGKETKGTVCSDCKTYINPGLYKKLNLTEGPLLERYEEAFKILYEEYFHNRLSVWDIYQKYGICFVTLKNLFRRHRINLRTEREGLLYAVEAGKLSPKAFPQFKTGWHTTWQGSKVFYRSSYELEYAQQLDFQRIPYEMESQRIRYFDTQQQKERIAIPDFYLPNTGELIEIKSSYTYNEQNMKDKFKAYIEHGFKPSLILEKEKQSLVVKSDKA